MQLIQVVSEMVFGDPDLDALDEDAEECFIPLGVFVPVGFHAVHADDGALELFLTIMGIGPSDLVAFPLNIRHSAQTHGMEVTNLDIFDAQHVLEPGQKGIPGYEARREQADKE